MFTTLVVPGSFASRCARPKALAMESGLSAPALQASATSSVLGVLILITLFRLAIPSDLRESFLEAWLPSGSGSSIFFLCDPLPPEGFLLVVQGVAESTIESLIPPLVATMSAWAPPPAELGWKPAIRD